MPGPAPMPTELKKIEGVRPCRINDKEPKYVPMVGKCPGWLPERAKTELHYLVDHLEKAGVLTAADRDVFTQYCWLVAQVEDLQAEIKEHGMIHTTPKGHRQPAPEVSMLREFMKLKNQLAQQLGLTPSSRTKIIVTPRSAEDELEGLCD